MVLDCHSKCGATQQGAKIAEAAMYIGSLGDTIFETSSGRLLTPAALKFAYESRFEDHPVQGFYEQSEFLAPSLATVNIDLILRSDLLGEPVLNIIQKLASQMRSGEILRMTIGGVACGRFTIRKMNWDWNYLLKSGAGPLSATVSLELKEYQAKR